MGKEAPKDDVTMAEAEGASPAKPEKQEDKQPPSPLLVLRSGVALIKKAVEQKETRTLFGRLLRQTAAVRRRFSAADLSAFLEGALPASSPAAAQLVEAVKQVWEEGKVSQLPWAQRVAGCAYRLCYLRSLPPTTLWQFTGCGRGGARLYVQSLRPFNSSRWAILPWMPTPHPSPTALPTAPRRKRRRRPSRPPRPAACRRLRRTPTW